MLNRNRKSIVQKTCNSVYETLAKGSLRMRLYSFDESFIKYAIALDLQLTLLL